MISPFNTSAYPSVCIMRTPWVVDRQFVQDNERFNTGIFSASSRILRFPVLFPFQECRIVLNDPVRIIFTGTTGRVFKMSSGRTKKFFQPMNPDTLMFNGADTVPAPVPRDPHNVPLLPRQLADPGRYCWCRWCFITCTASNNKVIFCFGAIAGPHPTSTGK